ncbi:MAG TPA: hypothetical protein VFR70_04445 [Flavobacterium sp.]|nr:hypothetical protein [Flavobacterium sp.]
MKNTKKWSAIDGLDYHYGFSADGREIGTMEIITKGLLEKKAIFKIFEKTFYLTHPSSWKSDFVIKDENGNVILEAFTKKWYGSTLVLNYKDKNLKLKPRNNPLAEYVIFDGDKEILSYGLSGIKIKIGPEDGDVDYLLDYVLWYLFRAIALEIMGNNFVFTD